NALQAQFRRRLSHGLQAIASYTWSHALDDDSTVATLRLSQRGNAAFDVRHLFAAAFTYDIPSPVEGGLARALLRGWSLDASAHAQSGLPVDLVARTATDPATGDFVNVRPNVVEGVPLYLTASPCPATHTA